MVSLMSVRTDFEMIGHLVVQNYVGCVCKSVIHHRATVFCSLETLLFNEKSVTLHGLNVKFYSTKI